MKPLKCDVEPGLYRSVSLPYRDDRGSVIYETVGTINADLRRDVIFQVDSTAETRRLEVAVRFCLMNRCGCQFSVVTQMVLAADGQMTLDTTAVSVRLSCIRSRIIPLLKLIEHPYCCKHQELLLVD